MEDALNPVATSSPDAMTRVLVADDDADLLDAVVSGLEEVGFTATAAATGAELVQRLADDGPFDVVVTDVAMPWMTGIQAAQHARYAGVATPLVVMTALDDPDIPRRVRALGAHAVFLRKPFMLADLQRAIDRACAALLKATA